MGANDNELFSDSGVDKVQGPEAALYFKSTLKNTKANLVTALDFGGAEWKKQLYELAYAIKTGAFMYETSYPTLESVLDICVADFPNIFPILSQSKGWEKLLSYYQNALSEKPAKGAVGPMSTWDEIKQTIEQLTAQFPSQDHKAILAAILAVLSDQHNSHDDENIQLFINVPVKQREALISRKLIGITHMLKDFITSGAYQQLNEREKPLFMNMYGQEIMIPLLRLFEESQLKQNNWIDKMGKEEDNFDENNEQFKKDQAEIRLYNDFMIHYMIYRNKALKLDLDETQN